MTYISCLINSLSFDGCMIIVTYISCLIDSISFDAFIQWQYLTTSLWSYTHLTLLMIIYFTYKYSKPHRWCNGECAHLKCSRPWVSALVGKIKDHDIGICYFWVLC